MSVIFFQFNGRWQIDHKVTFGLCLLSLFILLFPGFQASLFLYWPHSLGFNIARVCSFKLNLETFKAHFNSLILNWSHVWLIAAAYNTVSVVILETVKVGTEMQAFKPYFNWLAYKHLCFFFEREKTPNKTK